MSNNEVLVDEGRADLVNVLREKLQDLGEPVDVLESLSPPVRKRVEVLREIQCEHDELEAQFFKERAALEAKYQKVYQPLYKKRYEIVNGVVQVDESANDTTKIEEGEESSEVKGVPDFWLTAMKNNEIMVDEISKNDEEALKFLKDIQCSRIDDPKGFKLEFFFDTNPYFKNSILSKMYHLIDEDEPMLEEAIGTEIEWHTEKCLTQKIVEKKPKKGSKNSKPIKKIVKCDSFFNFFSPPEVPQDNHLDEDDVEELQNLIEQDYDIGLTIKNKIIPHAVSWFTGDAAEDFPDMEDGEDDDEGDDDEDDDDDDNEDDEEDHPTDKTKKSGRAAAGDDPEGERPPECKQQ